MTVKTKIEDELKSAEQDLQKHMKKRRSAYFDGGDTFSEEKRHLQGIVWGLKLALAVVI